MIQKILLLGDPLLYKKSEPVEESELSYIAATVTDLHDTLMDHRRRKGFGRGIAAPQIGVLKRLIYLYIDRPVLIINRNLHFLPGTSSQFGMIVCLCPVYGCKWIATCAATWSTKI